MLSTIIIILLVGIVILLSYLIRNLLVKVEKYEDVTLDQTKYLQDISKIISEGAIHLTKLDEKGHFQADDEVGEFFKQMQKIQEQLNKYMLPENYGEKKS